jgi:NADH:ubiquinone oxidoreductase subunit 2 (subunit N)
MLAPFFFKLGFFPFNGFVNDIYSAVSMPAFSIYASFYNLGASLIFVFFLFEIINPILPLAVTIVAICALCTFFLSVIGALAVDFHFRALLGYLSSGSTSLVFLPFLAPGLHFSVIGPDFIGGLFFYSLTVFCFISFIFSFSRFERYNRSISRSVADFNYFWAQRLTLGIFIFLLSGLPPTVAFLFKVASFDSTASFTSLLFIVVCIFFQIIFVCLYMSLLTTLYSTQAVLDYSDPQTAEESYELIDGRFANNRR